MIKQKIFLIAAFLAAFTICAFQINVAEAASIDYTITDVHCGYGEFVMNGYFENHGSTGGSPTRVSFLGYVKYHNRDINVDVSFSGSNLTVGYIAPNSRRSWSFTISDSRFIYYNGEPLWNIRSVVTSN